MFTAANYTSPFFTSELAEIVRFVSKLSGTAAIAAWVLISSLGAHSAQAEELAAFRCESEVSPEQAAKALAAVQSKYSSVRGIETRFLQEAYLSAMDASEKSSGSVKVLTPGRLKWMYDGDRPQTFLVKDETAWLYQKAENQVIISDFRNNVSSQLAVTFLLGTGNLLRDFESKGACKTARGTLLQLIPRANSEAAKEGTSDGLERFDLLVDEATQMPAGARTIDVAGNSNAVQFIGLTPLSSNSDADFAPTFPESADVQDHRIKKADDRGTESSGAAS